jgi:nucleoside-diphosphate-sugar epimerase
MKWMLTGGAGYIGAHILRALHDQGHDVVVLDDLSTGLLLASLLNNPTCTLNKTFRARWPCLMQSKPQMFTTWS